MSYNSANINNYSEVQRKSLYESLRKQKSPMTPSEKQLLKELKLYFNRKSLIKLIDRKFESSEKVYNKTVIIERYLENNCREYGTYKYTKESERLENLSKKSCSLEKELSMLINYYNLSEDEFNETKISDNDYFYEDYKN